MDPDALVHGRKYRFLLVSSLAAFIATLDASIVNVALPTLARSFAVGVEDVAWVVLAYALAITATLLLVGRVAARHGYRVVYVAGFSTFAAGSLLCAFSPTLPAMVVSRAIQGLGASALMASGPALVTRAFPEGERGRAMGFIGTAVGVGLMSGPPLGGLIVSTLGWSWIFLVNVPIGIAAAAYAGRLLRVLAPDDPGRRIDLPGVLFQAGAAILLLLVLNRLEAGWPAWVLASCGAGAALSLALFFWRETRTKAPLVGLDIFRHRQFTIAIAVMTTAFLASSSAIVLVPFLLEDLLREGPRTVGIVLATIPACTMVVAPVSGRISDAIGVRLLTTGGLALFVAGLLALTNVDASSGPAGVALRLALVGVGLGTFQAPNGSAMMTAVPRRAVGIASSLLALGRNLGIAGGVAVATAVFAHRRSLESAAGRPDGESFVAAFAWTLRAFALLAAVAVAVSAIRSNAPAPSPTAASAS